MQDYQYTVNNNRTLQEQEVYTQYSDSKIPGFLHTAGAYELLKRYHQGFNSNNSPMLTSQSHICFPTKCTYRVYPSASAIRSTKILTFTSCYLHMFPGSSLKNIYRSALAFIHPIVAGWHGCSLVFLSF